MDTAVLLTEVGRRALARTYASLRINELLNWQVAAAPTVEIADASVTKVYASERLQLAGSCWRRSSGATATRPTRRPPRCTAGSIFRPNETPC